MTAYAELVERAKSGDLELRLPMPVRAISLGGSDRGCDGEWQMVLQWFPDQWYRVNSFANGIETGHGGSHVKGFEQVLTILLNRYARQDHISILTEKDPNLEAADVRSGLGVILSVKVRSPQFVGQTKDELSNDETRVMVRSGFSEQFMGWMQENPAEIAVILGKLVEEMRLRLKVSALLDAERKTGRMRGLKQERCAFQKNWSTVRPRTDRWLSSSSSRGTLLLDLESARVTGLLRRSCQSEARSST